MNDCTFDLGKNPDLKSIESELTRLFPAHIRKTVHIPVCYYDTFDWRLYHTGFRLVRQGRKIYLESNKLRAPLIWAAGDHEPRTIRHILSRRMRDLLSPVIDVRALLPLIRLQTRGIQIQMLDNERKTLIRCLIEQTSIEEKNKNITLTPSLILNPVKGYEKEFLKVKQWGLNKGYNEIQSDLFVRAIQASGKKPVEYSSGIDIQIEPELSVAEATQKILAHLLKTIQQNVPGLVDDIDIEFLHDFRVAVRRIRSLFGQIKNVFHSPVARNAGRDFTEMGRLTNKMRDIDVYLLREQHYKTMLPPEIRQNLDPFFKRLRSDRVKELHKIKKYLSGPEYEQVMQKWIDFSIESYINVTSEEGKEKVYFYAQRVILKRFRKIIKLGNTIGPQSDDDVLHRLRIECKKLRYLLEFFISLFPKQKMNKLIRHLKKLQDNLGLYNDLSVQQNKLREFVKFSEPENIAEVSLALGVLVGRLYEEYQQVRLDFSKSFSQFSSQDMINTFIEMFESNAGVQE